MADIDIDIQDRDEILSKLPHVAAVIINDNSVKKHNTGVYFQNIPHDPLTGLSLIDYRQAEDDGYFKIDFLNNSVLKGIKSEAHLDKLAKTEPYWELLESEEFVNQLFHIGNHFDLINKLKPTSIKQLAMALAIIRPGKAHLRNKSWAEIEKEIWKPNPDGYTFKSSHAHAYSLTIVVQMNLIVEQTIQDAL